MTSLEITLTITLVIGTVMALYTIQWYREWNDELFLELCLNKSRASHLAYSGMLDSVLSVDKFNEWFNSPKDESIYAHPGIFLRLDKLSQNHLEDYIELTTCGVVSYGCFEWEVMKDFEDRIRKDWQNKLNN